MTTASKVLAFAPAHTDSANHFFSAKLAYETDCSDVYADIRSGNKAFVLLDVRSVQAFEKSHAITAVSMPHAGISRQSLSKYPDDTVFVVYCWGPGCNGASKAASKISALGYGVKEMIGGIHYWEDFERYPVNRCLDQAQV
ncbi:rhodanese-like domain-containing protein [Thalassomonas haliotis]|uniref:Sulfurtransferase n=1 Tax=Thalassomonas haliotis TaxID=485448 RepID=A0ABY7VK89_9GAMM|nr:rhodanese-like domain-containing protein [Thalassomonas haliotis]WDE13077.1 sulfurtransferase [Thalassomonas haliotis]